MYEVSAQLLENSLKKCGFAKNSAVKIFVAYNQALHSN